MGSYCLLKIKKLSLKEKKYNLPSPAPAVGDLLLFLILEILLMTILFLCFNC